MSNLISATALKALLDQQPVLIDTRFDLQDSAAGRQAYLAGHIPGAQYLDLNENLSSSPAQHGGRHPLPDWEIFVDKLGQAGVANDRAVVVYDDSANVFAGRLWWMLRYLGHEHVRLLDGGYSAWLEAGFPLENERPTARARVLVPHPQSEMLASMSYVKANLENPAVSLVDARAAERYRGEVEPLDPKAGHIPGALNLPFAGNLEGKHFKPAQDLAARFRDLAESEEIILYCGSGVSAAHNMIALEEAGIYGAKLYVGSWSDWSSFEDNPVETQDA